MEIYSEDAMSHIANQVDRLIARVNRLEKRISVLEGKKKKLTGEPVRRLTFEQSVKLYGRLHGQTTSNSKD